METKETTTRNSDTTTASGLELMWQNKETFLSLITCEDALTLSPKGKLEFYKNLTSLVRDRIQEVMGHRTRGMGYAKMPFMVPEYSDLNRISDEELSSIMIWRDTTLVFCDECQELKEIEEGNDFYHMVRKFKIGGQHEFSKGQLKGFNNAGGSWNDFSILEVNSCIDSVDKLLPRVEYNQNNPNNGRVQHQWTKVKDSITVKFRNIDQSVVEKIEKLWPEIETIFTGRGKADNCRIEKEDLGNPYLKETQYDLELVFWWD